MIWSFWMLVGMATLLVALWLDDRVTGRKPWPWTPGKGKRRASR